MSEPRLRLLDVGRAERAPRSRCTDLVPIEREECRKCRGPVERHAITELALFRHGGYGANRETRFLVCLAPKCRTLRIAEVVETNPRHS